MVVVVFSRTFDDNLASLVKEIDAVIEKNPEKKIGSYVNFLGDDFDRTKECVIEFDKKHNIKNVALVVPQPTHVGLKRLNIHADAQVTVIVYQMKPDREIKANHVFTKDTLNRTTIQAVIDDLKKHSK